MEHPKAWDILPEETPKAWAAFCVYRDLPIYGEVTRSIAQVGTQLGYADESSLARWSTKYDWVERAKAYDAYKSSITLTVKEVALADFSKAITANLTLRVGAILKIVDTQINRIIIAQEKEQERLLDASDLKQLVGVVKTLDDLNRRAAGMPTSYTSKLGQNFIEEDDEVFILGGHDAT